MKGALLAIAAIGISVITGSGIPTTTGVFPSLTS